jgi:putative polyketide hydroxylase
MPIGKLTVEQTLQRHYYRTGTAESRLVDYADLIFGYRYHSAAILAEPNANSAPLTQPPSRLCGEPGTRAPHLMWRRQGSLVSTMDLCGGKWTLLVGAQDTDWSEAAHSVAQEMGLLVSVHAIGEANGWKDIEDRFEECYGIGATDAVLVRPDGFIAWRSPGRVNHPHRQLKQAVSSILALPLTCA